MEYDQPWGKLSEKQASCSKIALSLGPTARLAGLKAEIAAGLSDDIEFR
jgi:hypothetical protein